MKILGIIIAVLGIAAILFSNYITSQVEEGKIKIARGEQTVDQTNQLFSLNPLTKQVGKGITQSGQKQIAAGKETISDYEIMAARLMTGGIIGCVIGGGLFLYSFFRKR